MTTPIKTAQKRWTEEQTVLLCDTLRDEPTREAVATKLGLTVKAVQARVQALRALGDKRVPPLGKGGIKLMAVPADFETRALRATNLSLCEHYQVSKCVIGRWRKQSGISRPAPKRTRTSFTSLLMPENFPALAPTMRLSEARAFFGVGNGPLQRWAKTAGIAFRANVVPLHPANRLKLDRTDARDMSRAGMAADYLRRFGPVFRCDERGNPEGKPTHWRRGSFVLTNDDIIERATRNGWRPDAWKALAA